MTTMSVMICFWVTFLIVRMRMKGVKMTLHANQERILMKTLYLMEILHQLMRVPSLCGEVCLGTLQAQAVDICVISCLFVLT